MAPLIENVSPFIQVIQYLTHLIQWGFSLIRSFIITTFFTNTYNPPTRHLYTTQEILQSAHRDKSIVPLCPAFFNKWISNPDSNACTDAIFYNPELYVPYVIEASEDISGPFVAKWRRRKLLCTIPSSTNTNILYTFLIEYNPVRLGFQYASDVSIPYTILNQAAMLYVKRFQCLDLFMDTTVCPSFRSPIIDKFNKFYFERGERNKDEDEQHSTAVLGRESLWNRNRRLKQNPKVKQEYIPEKFHLNTFFRIRSIQEEWTHSIKAVTQ